jgi:hypothetical protein
MIEIRKSTQQILVRSLLISMVLVWSGSLFAEALQKSGDVKVGPIWSNSDAQQKCPKVCSNVAATWNGNWTTTVYGSMSVCGCTVSACASTEICKAFEVAKEYTDSGTKANGDCESWLNVDKCAKGIPNNALQNYEIEIRGGIAYDKFNNKPFNSWAGGNKETLYVIDATSDRIYFINVDGRYIEARGTANCINQPIPNGQSTVSCAIPRLTTHAGILMGYVAGLPGVTSTPKEMTIKVKGAGTVKVSNGVINEITNDSGHFKPTIENLKITMNLFTQKGFVSFPTRQSGCPYDFTPVKGKDGVFSHPNTPRHCEL